MQASTPQIPATRRAIVLGGSLAGLLAARILSERFDEVVVIERDRLPEGAQARKGTPQAVHPHGLLARGREVLETLFPGFTDSLVSRGALQGDAGAHGAIDVGRQRMASAPIGFAGLAVSRLAIEAEVRRRVRALSAVRFIEEADLQSPLHDDGRVVGVRWRAAGREDAEPQTLNAALTVDCTGRGSRTPQWLRAWGYEPAPEERVTIGLAYTSVYVRRDERVRPEVVAVIGTATAEQPDPSILIAQEPDADGRARWVMGLGGYAGRHVDTTLEAMRQRAQATGQHEITALLTGAETLCEPMRYAFPHSQRRRYERLHRFPRGFLLMGDALASFNPVYGQGMTVAACEALALRDALATRPDDQWAPSFFRAAARVIDIPWQLTVGADLALPMVEGDRPLAVRIVNAYVARLQRVAVHDAKVANAFRRVIHLLAPPPSLFAPRILWRVLSATAPAPSVGKGTRTAARA